MAVITLSDIAASAGTGTGRRQLINISCDGGTTTHVTVPRSTVHNQPRHLRALISQAGFELSDEGQGKPQRLSLSIQQHVLEQI